MNQHYTLFCQNSNLMVFYLEELRIFIVEVSPLHIRSFFELKIVNHEPWKKVSKRKPAKKTKLIEI